MCEEYESHQDRSGQLDVLMGQPIVLSEIKAEVPLENDIPSHQNLLLQRYEERIERLSQENKVSKFCMDAGFISVVEKFYLGIHDRFIRDEKFRKNMFDTGRTEDMCREMDKLADEDHTHHITPEEIRVYRNNWWIRSNTVGSDTMPIRHRSDFKQALSTLRQLKGKEDAAHQQRWQSYSSSWWNWQESWGHSSYEHHHDDGPSTD